MKRKEQTERTRNRGLVEKAVVAVALAAALLAFTPSVAPAASDRIDINTATVEELQSLPGIGKVRAAAIVEKRTEKAFSSLADLTRVEGIGPRVLAELDGKVTVEKPRRR
jgi:competence protein ComEA